MKWVEKTWSKKLLRTTVAQQRPSNLPVRKYLPKINIKVTKATSTPNVKWTFLQRLYWCLVICISSYIQPLYLLGENWFNFSKKSTGKATWNVILVASNCFCSWGETPAQIIFVRNHLQATVNEFLSLNKRIFENANLKSRNQILYIVATLVHENVLRELSASSWTEWIGFAYARYLLLLLQTQQSKVTISRWT